MGFAGCPLSPLLYVLLAEVLACSIRANPHIAGLSLPGFSSSLPCISQYVDDTSLGVSNRAIDQFLMFTVSMRGGRGLNLISRNVKVFGSAPGMVGPMPLLLFLGLPLKSKTWCFSWHWEFGRSELASPHHCG